MLMTRAARSQPGLARAKVSLMAPILGAVVLLWSVAAAPAGPGSPCAPFAPGGPAEPAGIVKSNI